MVEGAAELSGSGPRCEEAGTADRDPGGGVPRHGAGRRRPALAAHRGARADHARATSSSAGAGSVRHWWPSRRHSGRPTVWSTAQYLSYAPTGSDLELSVTLAAEGRRVTQAPGGGPRRATPRSSPSTPPPGSPGSLDAEGVWVDPPEVPPPDECPPRRLPRLHLDLDLRPHRRAPGPGSHVRGDRLGSRGSRANPTAPCGPGCPATSSRRPPPWPSSATT